MGSLKAILGPILGSPEGLEGQLSVFEAPFSVPLGSQESSTASDRAKLYVKFFSGSAAVAAGHLVSADPVGRACGFVL